MKIRYLVGLLEFSIWLVATSVLELMSTRLAWSFVAEDASIDILDVPILGGFLWFLHSLL